jgi:hypothetical protein
MKYENVSFSCNQSSLGNKFSNLTLCQSDNLLKLSSEVISELNEKEECNNKDLTIFPMISFQNNNNNTSNNESVGSTDIADLIYRMVERKEISFGGIIFND